MKRKKEIEKTTWQHIETAEHDANTLRGPEYARVTWLNELLDNGGVAAIKRTEHGDVELSPEVTYRENRRVYEDGSPSDYQYGPDLGGPYQLQDVKINSQVHRIQGQSDIFLSMILATPTSESLRYLINEDGIVTDYDDASKEVGQSEISTVDVALYAIGSAMQVEQLNGEKAAKPKGLLGRLASRLSLKPKH